MTGVVSLATLVISLLGLAYLAYTDPKRRRVFGLSKLERRTWLWPGRLAVFAPGCLLLAFENWSGFTIWAGALTVLGWSMAAISPLHYADLLKRARLWLRDLGTHLGARFARVQERWKTWGKRDRAEWSVPAFSFPLSATRSSAAEIASLEERVAELEARLEALESRAGASKVNDPDPSQTMLDAAE